MSNTGSRGRKAATLCLALFVGWTAGAGEMVTTSKDIHIDPERVRRTQRLRRFESGVEPPHSTGCRIAGHA